MGLSFSKQRKANKFDALHNEGRLHEFSEKELSIATLERLRKEAGPTQCVATFGMEGELGAPEQDIMFMHADDDLDAPKQLQQASLAELRVQQEAADLADLKRIAAVAKEKLRLRPGRGILRTPHFKRTKRNRVRFNERVMCQFRNS